MGNFLAHCLFLAYVIQEKPQSFTRTEGATYNQHYLLILNMWYKIFTILPSLLTSTTCPQFTV